MKNLRWIIFLLVAVAGWGSAAPQAFVRNCEQWLTEFDRNREQVEKIHPALQENYPIVIAFGDSIALFRFNNKQQRYQFKTTAPAPFPLPQGIRAAMPVQIANWEMACVVSKDILDSHRDDVLLLHEFVHCWQWENGERGLKDSLEIHQQAMREQRYDWEISHPFPYHQQEVRVAYRAWVESLEAGTINPELRKELRSLLDEEDYQYLLWEEWKEGLARAVENRIRVQLNLPENLAGSDNEFSRVSFYWGGEWWIKVLQHRYPGVIEQPAELFRRMQNCFLPGSINSQYHQKFLTTIEPCASPEIFRIKFCA